MVKKLSEMAEPLRRGGGGGGNEDDDEEDKKRGAWGGDWPKKYLNGTVHHPVHNEEEEQEEIAEDAVEGQHLYLDFLSAQVAHEGLVLPPGFPHENLDRISPAQLMDWTRAGRELRMMADAFARSPERESVRMRAQKVSRTLEVLDFDNFLKLLQELFQEGGVTRERILVLFFFCADVALEALRKGYKEMFSKLIRWSLAYISTQVAQWVHTHGGWGVVLRSSLNVAYQVTACCAFIAVMAACVVYIRRNI